MMEEKRIDVLGLPVDLLEADSALAMVEECILERGLLQVVTLNAEMAILSRVDKEFEKILLRSRLVLPDGSGVVWAARRQGRKVKKLAGVDFAKSMASRAAERGWGVFLLGAKKAVVEAAAAQLMKDNPGIRISGVQDGYFQSEEEAAEKVRSAKPDILLVALGVPRQEKWISEYQEKLGIPVCMGVGGTFDVLAGTVKRAPGLMRSLQLEWLFRLYQEPWRWRRMIRTLPLFVWLVWQGRKEGAS